MSAICGAPHNSELYEFGNALNEYVPNTFKGRPDFCGGRFSVDIFKNGSWDEHLLAITAFIKKTAAILESAKDRQIDIQLDIALYASDVGDEYLSFSWCIPKELLRLLLQYGISLVHTYYDDIERVDKNEDEDEC